jgi:hypothetical protein
MLVTYQGGDMGKILNSKSALPLPQGSSTINSVLSSRRGVTRFSLLVAFFLLVSHSSKVLDIVLMIEDLVYFLQIFIIQLLC